MKKLKVMSVAFVFILLASVSTSTAVFSEVKDQSFSSLIKSNQSKIINIDPKIKTILEMIDEDLLREYLETLVGYGPRMTGTYGCKKSAEYIFNQFNEMNLETRYQNWTAFGNIYHPRLFKSQNVEGILRGNNLSSERIILFGAHYDTVKISPGGRQFRGEYQSRWNWRWWRKRHQPDDRNRNRRSRIHRCEY